MNIMRRKRKIEKRTKGTSRNGKYKKKNRLDTVDG